MAKKQEQIIMIKKPNIDYLKIDIVGDTPVNIHRLGKKLKDEFDFRDQNKPIKKRGARDKHTEFMDSLYYINAKCEEVETPKTITPSTKFGFPSSGFKKAMVYAARQYQNIKMTELRGRFFVMNAYVEIKGKPVMDEFWRRIGGKGPGTGTPDIGVRAVFPKWSASLHIKYNKDVISAESVVNLLQTAGLSVGIGEDRPDKAGNTFGMWHVK